MRDSLHTAGAGSSPKSKDHDSLHTAGARSLSKSKDRDSLHIAGAQSSPKSRHVKIPKVKNVLYARRVLNPRQKAAPPLTVVLLISLQFIQFYLLQLKAELSIRFLSCLSVNLDLIQLLTTGDAPSLIATILTVCTKRYNAALV